MSNKLTITLRFIFSAALFILIAGLFTTTTVQSAVKPVHTVSMNVVNDNGGTSDLESSPLSVNVTSLLLAKNVTNDNGGTAGASAWTLYAGTNSVTGSETPVEVTSVAGTYALSESTVAGYSLTSLTCDNAVGEVTEVTVGTDETVTCTFVNDDIAPKLTLRKTVINLDGGTLTQANFPSFLNGSPLAWDTQATLTANVVYTASETSIV